MAKKAAKKAMSKRATPRQLKDYLSDVTKSIDTIAKFNTAEPGNALFLIASQCISGLEGMGRADLLNKLHTQSGLKLADTLSKK